MGRARVKRVRDKQCEHCGKSFHDESSWAYRKTCSIECRDALRVVKTRKGGGYNRTTAKLLFSNTTDNFLKKVHEIHGDAFDYSRVVYVNRETAVAIGCKACGEWFEQAPKVHYRGGKCTKCRYKRIGDLTRLTTELFVEKARAVHGDRYSYEHVEYARSHTKVKLKCNECDILFMSKPNNVLNGHGCPNCANLKKVNNWVSSVETVWLDAWNIPSQARQSWITLENRIVCVDALHDNTVYEFYGGYWHGDPRQFRPRDRNRTNGISYGELYNHTLERAKQIRAAGYKMIEVWEYDWQRGELQSNDLQ